MAKVSQSDSDKEEKIKRQFIRQETKGTESPNDTSASKCGTSTGEFKKHFLWAMVGPDSLYLPFKIHICKNVPREDKIDPPIDTDCFLSGGATTQPRRQFFRHQRHDQNDLDICDEAERERRSKGSECRFTHSCVK